MSKELHCFILWENARKLENEIIEDIRKHFDIIKIYEISWNKSYFLHNLCRLYNKNIFRMYKKLRTCGNGKFLFITVADTHPKINKYGINTNICNAKNIYRKMVSNIGKFLVHASDNTVEADFDIRLILGTSASDFLYNNKIITDNTHYIPHTSDMLAQYGWKSKKQLLDFIKTVPDTKIISAKKLEFATNNKSYLLRLINASQSIFHFNSNKFKVKIANKTVPIYIKSEN